MTSVKHYSTLITPVYSEKATNMTEQSKYTFKVAIDSNKLDIKQSVEKIFGVKVVAVNITRNKPKEKVFKGRKGTRSAFKKAIVTLEKGKTIDFSKGA